LSKIKKPRAVALGEMTTKQKENFCSMLQEKYNTSEIQSQGFWGLVKIAVDFFGEFCLRNKIAQSKSPGRRVQTKSP